MKRPSFQFYPGDWQRDTALRSCSIAARGLWVDMLCLMHDGTPYGYLKVGVKAITSEILARMVGIPLRECEGYLRELEEVAVFSRDESGTIFSRRMVRDEEARNRRAEGGSESTRPPAIDSKRRGLPGRLFRFMVEKWGGCLMCGTDRALEVHRIKPGRHGGKYEPGNVILLCGDDHRRVTFGELPIATILAHRGIDTLEGICEGFQWLPSETPPASASASASASALHPPLSAARDPAGIAGGYPAEFAGVRARLAESLPDGPDRQAVLGFIAALPVPDQPAWASRLTGYLGGLDFPAGMCPTPGQLATACRDYSGTPNPIHFRSFVLRILKQRPSDGKAGPRRSAAATGQEALEAAADWARRRQGVAGA